MDATDNIDVAVGPESFDVIVLDVEYLDHVLKSELRAVLLPLIDSDVTDAAPVS